MSNPLPLEGIRVLDVTIALAGPHVTYLLGALGAEVVKVEAPGGSDMGRHNPPYACSRGIHFDGPLHDDDQSVSALGRLRNKRSVTIDAKQPAGRDLLRRLAARSDVLVHNIRGSSATTLGIDYDDLRERCPDLIYCAVSAFGGGPHGDIGMDIMVQALSGLMAVTGEADGPPLRVGIPIADMVAPLYACIGVFAALRARDAGLGGQRVDVNMLDVMTSLIASEHFDVLESFGMPIRTGNSLARMGPFGTYPTGDGHVSVAASQDRWCHDLFTAMGRPDLIQDERLRTRGARAANADLVDALVGEWTGARTSAAVVAHLKAHRVPCAEVRDPASAVGDPGVRERGAVAPLHAPGLAEPVAVTGNVPLRFSRSGVRHEPTRPLGADTDDVLVGILGLSVDEVATLREAKIV
jgi:crotonobetainyl-CoA:carnitine CoA-transferase CaiB-like acyl-CoA transferase